MRSILFYEQEILALKNASKKKHLIETLLIDHVHEDEINSFFTGITKIILAPLNTKVTLNLDSNESSIIRDLTHNYLISEGLDENRSDELMNANTLGEILEKISEKLFE